MKCDSKGLVDSMVKVDSRSTGCRSAGWPAFNNSIALRFPNEKKNEMVILTIKFNIIKLNLSHTSLWLCADLFHSDI